MATYRYDVLIIGSGAAGLTVALRLPDGAQAALLSKGELTHASTYYAQGGVAAVRAARRVPARISLQLLDTWS